MDSTSFRTTNSLKYNFVPVREARSLRSVVRTQPTEGRRNSFPPLIVAVSRLARYRRYASTTSIRHLFRRPSIGEIIFLFYELIFTYISTSRRGVVGAFGEFGSPSLALPSRFFVSVSFI